MDAFIKQRYREEGYGSMSQFSLMTVPFLLEMKVLVFAFHNSHLITESIFLLNDVKKCLRSLLLYMTTDKILFFFATIGNTPPQSCSHKFVQILPSLPYPGADSYHFIGFVSI